MSDRATLKAFFETGDFPTQAQFTDLIDQLVNIPDDYGKFGAPKTVELAISSAQILALNSAPLQLLAAAGAGTAFLPLWVLWQYVFVTTAYATNGIVALKYASAGELFVSSVSSMLFAGANRQFAGIILNSVPAADNIAGNDDLEVFVPLGNPTLGDGTLNVLMLYHQVDLT